MLKETYEAPVTEIINFDTEDVITTSGIIIDPRNWNEGTRTGLDW